MKLTITQRLSACGIALGLVLGCAVPVKAAVPQPVSPLPAMALGFGVVAAYKVGQGLLKNAKDGISDPIKDAGKWLKNNAWKVAISGGVLSYYVPGFNWAVTAAASKAVSGIGTLAANATEAANKRHYAPFVDDYRTGYINRFTATSFGWAALGAGLAMAALSDK